MNYAIGDMAIDRALEPREKRREQDRRRPQAEVVQLIPRTSKEKRDKKKLRS